MKKTIKLGLVTIMVGMLNVISASSLTYQSSSNIDFTINPSISLTLSSSDLIIDNLAPGSASDSNIITVDVSTNAGYGYYLSATTGIKDSANGTNLVHSENSNYIFTNLTSNAPNLNSITAGYWGYSYSTDNGATWVSGDNGNASTGYNGLPLDNDDSGITGIKLIDTSSYFNATSSIKFKVGAKATTNQPSGAYTGTVNFYAVANPSPITFDDAYAANGKTKTLGYYKIQDTDSTICQAVGQGFNTKLIDVRDNEVYTVAKLKDDNCWMLDNLRLGSDHPITLTDQDTNMVNENWVLPANMTFTNFPYTEAQISTDFKNDISEQSWGIGSGKIGVYYNFCAASAGTYCYPENSGVDNLEYDICPLNWHAPSKIMYDTINEKYNYESNADNRDSTQYNLSLNTSGYINNNTFSRTHYPSHGYLWSSTIYSASKMWHPLFTQSSFRTDDFDVRVLKLPIRCLVK